MKHETRNTNIYHYKFNMKFKGGIKYVVLLYLRNDYMLTCLIKKVHFAKFAKNLRYNLKKFGIKKIHYKTIHFIYAVYTVYFVIRYTAFL